MSANELLTIFIPEKDINLELNSKLTEQKKMLGNVKRINISKLWNPNMFRHKMIKSHSSLLEKVAFDLKLY